MVQVALLKEENARLRERLRVMEEELQRSMIQNPPGPKEHP